MLEKVPSAPVIYLSLQQKSDIDELLDEQKHDDEYLQFGVVA